MSASPTRFSAFLRAVQRRMVFVSLAERVCVCVLAMSLAGVVAAAGLIWFGRSARTLAEISLPVGAMAGIIWGLISRPTLLQAALTADRQLHADELLSTAWMFYKRQPNRNDPWLVQISAQAEARCTGVSPYSLRVSRLSCRTWGGAALAAAMVIALSQLGPAPTGSGGDGQGNRLTGQIGSAAHENHGPNDRFASADNRPILLSEPDETHGSHFGQNPSAPQDNAKPQASDDPTAHDANSQLAAKIGTGGGSARTTGGNTGTPPPAAPHAGAGTESADPIAQLATGAGAATGNIKRGDATPGGAAAANGDSASSSPAPWTASDWTGDIQRAQAAVNAGQVPAQYRDLVRGYFAE